MIVDKDIHPERKIYYLGALVLKALESAPSDNIDFFHAFQKVNEQEKISINMFTVNCQYVLPVLRDKLPKDIDVAQYEVLSLSQNDKLFKQN